METAMVHESPILAKYFTKLTLRYIVPLKWVTDTNTTVEASEALQYLLLINRRYIPFGIRSKARAVAVDALGSDVVERAETIVRAYCSATTEEELVVQVLRFYLLCNQLGVTPGLFDEHPTFGETWPNLSESADSPDEQGTDIVKLRTAGKASADGSADEQDDSPKKGNSPSKTADKPDPKSEDKGDNGGGNGQDDQDQGNSDGSDGSDDSDDSDDTGDSGDSGDSDDSTSKGAGDGSRDTDSKRSLNEDIQDELSKLTEQLKQDSDVVDTIRSINEDLHRNGEMLLEPEDGSGKPFAGELLAQAEEIALRLSQSFDSAISATLPVWEEGHRTGVVNAFRYRTRTAGDHNYRRTLSSEGNSGVDIAVSLLLDVSGSMGAHEASLSQSAYAVKKACDLVDIDCAVVTFDNECRELYRSSDRHVEPVALSASGGTNPSEALRVLDSHREGQKYHLVVVLTDGVWTLPKDGPSGVEEQYQDGRVFLGVSLGGDYLKGLGFHSVVNIDNITPLPEIVRDFLLNFLG